MFGGGGGVTPRKGMMGGGLAAFEEGGGWVEMRLGRAGRRRLFPPNENSGGNENKEGSEVSTEIQIRTMCLIHTENQRMCSTAYAGGDRPTQEHRRGRSWPRTGPDSGLGRRWQVCNVMKSLASETLTGLFDRVGLRTNVSKTMGMVCRPCQAAGVRVDEAYTRQMTGEGRSFKERQRERVLCPECGKEMAKGSLVAHRQTQHGVAKGRLGQEGKEEAGGDEPRTYRMAFPAKAGPRPRPV